MPEITPVPLLTAFEDKAGVCYGFISRLKKTNDEVVYICHFMKPITRDTDNEDIVILESYQARDYAEANSWMSDKLREVISHE